MTAGPPATPVLCPDPDALRRALAGTTDERVLAHLETCPECARRAGTLDRGPDRTAVLHAAADPTPAAHAAPLVERLKRMWADRPPAFDPVERVVDALDPAAGPGELGRVGHYAVRRHLGTGGMGVVFTATDTRLDRPVAVKFLHPRLSADPAARARFLAEARATAAVRHDRVAAVFDAGGDDRLPFLVMEELAGETLDARLRRGRLSVAEAARVGREIAEGLAAAHAAGLLHRDVKPANVWLDAGTGRVRLLDFGLARPVEPGGERVTDTGQVVGTPAFMAPEQATAAAADGRADLFSLGCVLYLMLAGELPFPGATPLAVLASIASRTPPPLRALNPAVSPRLAALVGRLLAKEPGRRPASAAAVAAELAVAADDLPRAARRAARRRGLLRAGLFATAALLVAAPGVIIRVTTKDGKKVDIYVEDGAKFEIVSAAPPKAEVAPPPIPHIPPADAAHRLRREDIRPDELLAAGGGDPARVPPELVAVFGDSRLRHWGTVNGVAWHPSGDRLATVASDGVREWDATTGRLRRHVPTTTTHGAPRAVYSPDGATIAYLKYVGQPVNAYRLVVVADAATGTVRRTIPGHTGQVFDLAFTPDSASLVACDDDGWVRRWAVATGAPEWAVAPLGRFGASKEQPRLTAARLSPDGKLVAVAGNRNLLRAAKAAGVPADDPVVILDAATGATVWEAPRRAWSLAWSGGGKYLATELNGKVEVWDVPARKLVAPVTSRSGWQFFRFTFHPADPDRLVIAGQDQRASAVFEWSVSRGAMLRVERVGHWFHPEAVAFSPDGRVLAVGAPEGLTRLDAATWRVIPTPGAVTSAAVNDIVVTPDGRFAYSVSSDLAVRRWNLGDPTGRPETIDTHPTAGRLLRLSADGAALSVFGAGAPTHRLDLTATPAKRAVVLPGRPVDASADGSRYVGRIDKTLAVWDAAGRQVGSPAGVEWDGSEELVLAPDGRTLVQVRRFGPVALFDATTGHRVWEFAETKGTDWGPSTFSPDGRTLALRAGSAVLLLDPGSGELRQRLHGNENGALLSPVAFAPDGKTVAAAFGHGRIRVWDVATGRLRQEFRGGPHGWTRIRLAFTPDGRHLVSGNPNGTVYVFRLADR